MLFIIRAEDKPGALSKRMEIRPRHLDYLNANKHLIKVAGAMLDDAGDPMGSVLVVDVSDKAAAQAFADGDPFAADGIFGTVTVSAYRTALGAWVA